MLSARILEEGELVERTFRNGNDLWLHAQLTGCYVERYEGTEEFDADQDENAKGGDV